MVIKLIKNGIIDSFNDFRNVILSTVIAFAILTFVGLNPEGGSGFIYVMLFLAMYALLIASAVITIMAFIRLLYKSLYREESYRAFTQPVASWEILISKIVLVLFWSAIVISVTVLSAFISLSLIFNQISDVMAVVNSFIAYVTQSVDWSLYFVWGFESIVSTIYSASLFLVVGAIVNSRYFQNRRVLFFVIIWLAAMFMFGQLFTLFEQSAIIFDVNPNIAYVLETTTSVNSINWSDILTISVSGQGVQSILLLSFLKLLLSGFMGFITVWFWDNKLEVID